MLSSVVQDDDESEDDIVLLAAALMLMVMASRLMLIRSALSLRVSLRFRVAMSLRLAGDGQSSIRCWGDVSLKVWMMINDKCTLYNVDIMPADLQSSSVLHTHAGLYRIGYQLVSLSRPISFKHNSIPWICSTALQNDLAGVINPLTFSSSEVRA